VYQKNPALVLPAALLILYACQPADVKHPTAEASMPFFIEKQGELPPLPDLPYLTDTLIKTLHFQIIAHGEMEADVVKNMAECFETSRQNILRFTGYEGQLPMLTHHLYQSSEQKGMLLQNTTHSHTDFEKNEVHTILNDCYKNNFIGEENAWLLRKILGQPKTNALEHGLAIHFTHHWQEKGYEYWAAKLAISGSLLPLSGILDNEKWDGGASLQSGCLSAALVDFLIKKWGQNTFLEKYASWQPALSEIEALEAEWQQFMGEKTFVFAHVFEQERSSSPSSLPYLKGFNFTHEGYRIYNGYGSRMADQALEKMIGLGVNAVAIVPYTFIRDPNKPAPFPVVQRAGTETDESVIQSAETAKKLGMAVLLKPQIWLGRGHWTGDLDMQTEEDWQAFFDHYGRWMIHYAMLAEIYQWDALCIGTEMVQTTLKREADWRRLIQKIRGIYNGKLTYAANWGEEFEKTGLWDDLDFIGLNCYYPLSTKDSPSDRELRKGFDGILKKIEKVYRRYHKPLFFTEIGFASLEAPWKKPHEDRGEVTSDFEGQRRCYETIFEGIAGKPWCGGILWWKFPSHLEERRRHDTDFSPYGKPAEKVVQQWFSGEKLMKGSNR
jgi:hypothetical protein